MANAGIKNNGVQVGKPASILLLLALLLALSNQLALAQQPATERVIVVFKPGARTARLDVQKQAQSAEVQVVHQFKTLPGLAANVTPAGLAQLQHNPDVLLVSEDLPVRAAQSDSTAFIKADIVQQMLGITGVGVNVALLDSGIDVNHPDFSGHIVAQRCFNKNNTCPPDNLTQSDNAQDENRHGTHVAGIVRRVAPGAGLVAVRVLDANGSGYTSDVLAGLDWVLANQAQLNIKIVNLSLGGGSYAGACDQADANTMLYAAAVETAKQAGLTLFAASGNGGKTDEMIAPACVEGVIAVGNAYHNAFDSMGWPTCTDTPALPDQVACSSNSSSVLDLLAPGTRITSTALGGGQRVESGTSMSVPHASGVAALLLQAEPSLSPDEIELILKTTGQPVTDSRNGRVTPRLDALAAVGAVRPTATISGTVRLQGRRVYSGTQIFASQSPCEAADFSTPATFTDEAGHFELLTLSPPGCLQAVRPNYLSAQLAYPAGDVGQVTLLAGDLNGDGTINIFDLVRVAQRFDTNDPNADIDASGVVNILDLALMAQNFKLQGPVAWPTGE